MQSVPSLGLAQLSEKIIIGATQETNPECQSLMNLLSRQLTPDSPEP
ncbi:hypothetical protein SAMN05443661_106110 [Natronobacterium gregoryi]|uniref:Uncharacterized protein n=1 Tax=Natronobacterium gregoryi TaxID=44930 RepID=A0A1I3LD91_9EURY|nr:hypothetical protein SAMN05443661_106110 [Natronobacterium gregoryi]